MEPDVDLRHRPLARCPVPQALGCRRVTWPQLFTCSAACVIDWPVQEAKYLLA